MIEYSDAQEVIEKCFEAMEKSSLEKTDSEIAEKTASLLLVAQMKLSYIIEQVELNAKNAKNDIERIEGEKYFELKEGSLLDKKLTENALANGIAKDNEVVSAKRKCAEAEAELRKYIFIMGNLKDAHIFFRNSSKAKQWAE